MPGVGAELTGRGGGGEAVRWAAMQQVEGVGAATMLRLARVFGSPAAALAAPLAELVARGGLSPAQAEGLQQAARGIEAIRARISALGKQGITVCAVGEPGYPDELLDLRGPPPLLYLRGELRAEDRRSLAVVGTREPDRAGARLAGALACGLAERGFTIVSGLARGVDTAAHRGALRAREGRTVAVLGSGLLRIYPPENGMLAARIARRGCVLAEVPPDTGVERRFLLARDRLQAALSRAVVVVQARAECGSIVTARHAVRCGRQLYAVPWDRPPFSEGWQKLLSLGARPVTGVSDLGAIAAEVEAWKRPAPQPPLV